MIPIILNTPPYAHHLRVRDCTAGSAGGVRYCRLGERRGAESRLLDDAEGEKKQNKTRNVFFVGSVVGMVLERDPI